jgi:hypothetical protein
MDPLLAFLLADNDVNFLAAMLAFHWNEWP